MQRVMRAFLSGFFTWCIIKRHMTHNPCREVRIKKPKSRDVYIPDGHFIAIREALVKDKNGCTVRSGEIMQCFVDLCYLTMQRSTDVRNLQWSNVDRDAKVIHFLPSKTEDSTGEAVDWPITPEIDAVLERARTFGKVKSTHVIHSLSGKPHKATAVRSAWDRACVRAGLGDVVYGQGHPRAGADGCGTGWLHDGTASGGGSTLRRQDDGNLSEVAPDPDQRYPDQYAEGWIKTQHCMTTGY